MLKDEILIAPSILTANFSNLSDDIKRLEKAGASVLHLDVMDGHFVPNISFGPNIIKAIDKTTDLILDTHLMISNPDNYLEQFKEAGSDILTVHVEVCTHLHRTISKIKELGMYAGVSLNPATSLSTIEEVLPYLDLVLIMSVNPGFGGQTFIETSLQKIENLASLIKKHNLKAIIEVDGGVDLNTIQKIHKAGAHYFVAGNAIFGNRNIEYNYSQLVNLLR